MPESERPNYERIAQLERELGIGEFEASLSPADRCVVRGAHTWVPYEQAIYADNFDKPVKIVRWEQCSTCGVSTHVG